MTPKSRIQILQTRSALFIDARDEALFSPRFASPTAKFIFARWNARLNCRDADADVAKWQTQRIKIRCYPS
jgi:hypothetical protein